MEDEAKLAVARAYAPATREGDAEGRSALTEPDAVVGHNYDEREGDRDRMLATAAGLRRAAPDVPFDDVAVQPTSTGFVWQAVIRGTGAGGVFRAPTCVVVTLSGGAAWPASSGTSIRRPSARSRSNRSTPRGQRVPPT